MTRRVVSGFATVAGGLAFTAGLATTVARYVPPEVVPIAGDSWGIVTAFTDFGLAGYLVALLALALAAGLRFSRARLAALIVTVCCAVLHGSWIVPWFVPAPTEDAPSGTLRVLSANLYFGAGDPDDVLRLSREADVVVLTEITERNRQRLLDLGLDEDFPHELAARLPKNGAAGTTVFSRYPITSTTALPAEIANQNWLVTLDATGLGPVTLAAVHPARPNRGRSGWTEDHRLLRSALPSAYGPVIVAGDFNAVESHRPMRRLRADGFRSSTDLAGAGWQPTWPVDRHGLPPVVGIDHVLLGTALTATSSRTVSIAGSDHLGVLATITRR